jgi:hypothetical protein
VTSPQDLGTIKKSIEEGTIKTTPEFVESVRLVFTNCMLYNMDDSALHKIAKAELDRFDACVSKDLVRTAHENSASNSTSAKRRRVADVRASSHMSSPHEASDALGNPSDKVDTVGTCGRASPSRKKSKKPSGDKAKTKRCIHGTIKYACPDPACGTGSLLCLHGRYKAWCTDPACVAACHAGGAMCEHGRQRKYCKVPGCGGQAMCEHGRQRKYCKVPGCGGQAMCEHGRQRNACRACGGTSICAHGRYRNCCRPAPISPPPFRPSFYLHPPFPLYPPPLNHLPHSPPFFYIHRLPLLPPPRQRSF